MRFGISPFGIWKSGHPSTVTGLSAYDAISCDAVAWLENESIDYLAPQLYWSETSAQQKFSHLTNWWAMQLNGRHLFPGHAVYRLRPPDVGHDWPLAEIEGQIEYARTKRADGVQGAVHFRMSEVRDNTKGLKTLFGETLYKVKAFPPPLPRAEAVVAPAVPFVQLDGDTLQVGHPVPATVRAYLLYRQLSPGEWELAEVSGLPVTDFTVSSGTWAVSAIGRGGGESQGVRVVVP